MGASPDGGVPDQFAIADLNRDGRRDIVVTNEASGRTSGVSTYWFEQPQESANANWTRHIMVKQATTNSLSVADMDHDADVDIIIGEHAGTKKIAVWENDGKGNFIEHIVDTGKESHSGARVKDMDGDGDLDILSIAYNKFQTIHL